MWPKIGDKFQIKRWQKTWQNTIQNYNRLWSSIGSEGPMPSIYSNRFSNIRPLTTKKSVSADRWMCDPYYFRWEYSSPVVMENGRRGQLFSLTWWLEGAANKSRSFVRTNWISGVRWQRNEVKGWTTECKKT